MKAELFDRYVHEVGRHLPKSQRADVATELHSLLMDALQDRREAQEPMEESNLEADQVAILKTFGPPEKVAAQYQPPHHYLIGPRLFQVYLIVVASVTGGLAIAYLLLFGLVILGEPQPFTAMLPQFGELFASYLGAVLKGLGGTTLVFAVLERVLPESAFDDEDNETTWDPTTLSEISDHNRIEVNGLVVETAFLFIALIIFNIFSEWIGIGFVASVNNAPGRWYMIPLLSSEFTTLYLPLLNVAWIAHICLNVVLLRQGRWQRLTRVVDFLLAVFGVFILYRIVNGPSILSSAAIESASLRNLVDTLLSRMLHLGLIVAMIVSIIDAIQKLFKIFPDHGLVVLRKPEA